MSSSTKTSAKKVAKKADTVVVVATPAPAVVAPVVAAVVAAEPVEKKARRVKSKAVEAAAPVAAPVSLPTPVDAAAPAVAVVAPVVPLEDDFRAVVTHLSTLKETLGGLFAEVKRLEKRVGRDLRDARKRRRRNRVVEGADGEVKPTRPSIFEIPTTLTEELNTFLGNPKGTQMSRSAVTKAITKYVKDNNLKNKHDINPDAPLRKLLAVDESIQLSYFNLQRYLNKHYVKVVKEVATA